MEKKEPGFKFDLQFFADDPAPENVEKKEDNPEIKQEPEKKIEPEKITLSKEELQAKIQEEIKLERERIEQQKAKEEAEKKLKDQKKYEELIQLKEKEIEEYKKREAQKEIDIFAKEYCIKEKISTDFLEILSPSTKFNSKPEAELYLKSFGAVLKKVIQEHVESLQKGGVSGVSNIKGAVTTTDLEKEIEKYANKNNGPDAIDPRLAKVLNRN